MMWRTKNNYIRQLEYVNKKIQEEKATLNELHRLDQILIKSLEGTLDLVGEELNLVQGSVPNITQFELDIIINDLLCLKERLPS